MSETRQTQAATSVRVGLTRPLRLGRLTLTMNASKLDVGSSYGRPAGSMSG